MTTMSFVEGASEIGEFNFVAKEMELDLDRYSNITVLSKCLKKVEINQLPSFLLSQTLVSYIIVSLKA